VERDIRCAEGLEARYGVGLRVDGFSRGCPVREPCILTGIMYSMEKYKNLQPTDDD